MQLPKARTSEILEQETGGELLIYDLRTDKAYNLNETCKAVYKACDGITTFSELRSRAGLADDLIHLALDDLKRHDLLAGDYLPPFAGLSRRAVIRRTGLACAVALPVISSLVAPTAAQATSGIRGCVTINQCQRAGVVYCLPGCEGTRRITVYDTTNGTCGGTATTYDVDCSGLQGQPTPTDFRRLS